jgi:hypothetical protein
VGAFRSHLTAKTIAVAAATTIGTRISASVKSLLGAPAEGVVAVSIMVSARVGLVPVASVFVIVAVGVAFGVVAVVGLVVCCAVSLEARL